MTTAKIHVHKMATTKPSVVDTNLVFKKYNVIPTNTAADKIDIAGEGAAN